MALKMLICLLFVIFSFNHWIEKPNFFGKNRSTHRSLRSPQVSRSSATSVEDSNAWRRRALWTIRSPRDMVSPIICWCLRFQFMIGAINMEAFWTVSLLDLVNPSDGCKQLGQNSLSPSLTPHVLGAWEHGTTSLHVIAAMQFVDSESECELTGNKLGARSFGVPSRIVSARSPSRGLNSNHQLKQTVQLLQSWDICSGYGVSTPSHNFQQSISDMPPEHDLALHDASTTAVTSRSWCWFQVAWPLSRPSLHKLLAHSGMTPGTTSGMPRLELQEKTTPAFPKQFDTFWLPPHPRASESHLNADICSIWEPTQPASRTSPYLVDIACWQAKTKTKMTIVIFSGNLFSQELNHTTLARSQDSSVFDSNFFIDLLKDPLTCFWIAHQQDVIHAHQS